MKQTTVVQVLRCSACKKHNIYPTSCQRFSSTAALAKINDREQTTLFMKKEVQDILKRMTGVNPEVVLPRALQKKKIQKITLMTNEQLNAFQEQAVNTAKQHLQMPPVLPPRQAIDVVLSKDHTIAGFSQNKHVFIDTTLGIHERERTVVVREPDGTLKLAPWEVRDRISQVYYPRSGRKIIPAAMFETPYIKSLLDAQKYTYLLDNACAQFEPDHPLYIKICHMVYEHCDINNSYNKVRFTRHFGPMIYFFVCMKQITGVMNAFILENSINQCLHLIQLYNHVWHPDTAESHPADDASLRSKADYIVSFLKSKDLLTYDMESELQQYVDEQEELHSKHSTIESGDLSSDTSSSSSSSSDSDDDK